MTDSAQLQFDAMKVWLLWTYGSYDDPILIAAYASEALALAAKARLDDEAKRAANDSNYCIEALDVEGAPSGALAER